MKLDYAFIKQILLTLEDNEEHIMELGKILDVLNIKEDKELDRFIGHVKVLGDNFYIESTSRNYGIENYIGGMAINDNAMYRLTARGYEFLDILKNDTVFSKVKNLSIQTAFDVGKSMLTNYLTGLV